MKSVNQIIDKLIVDEGGFVDNPKDPGGPTKYGITEKVAREHGYKAEMRDLPESLARAIYYSDYVIKPGFDKVLLLSADIAAELVDTGVNCGQPVAAKFLQLCLNSFNLNGKIHADLVPDGDIGPATINALRAYLSFRKEKAAPVMLKALNCLQGAHYITAADKNQKLEAFTFGWFDNRVEI